MQQVVGNLPCKPTAEKVLSRQWPDLHGEGKTHALEGRAGYADFDLMETKPGKKVVPKKRQWPKAAWFINAFTLLWSK